MKLTLTGGAWITAGGRGLLSDGSKPLLAPGEPLLPRGKDLFDPPLARYGRFDRYTRLGCAAVALALRDAGLAETGRKRPIGIVSASRTECLETDLAYYRTTLENGGAFASPNLFCYTQPGIVLGECAVHFGLTGPTLCVGQPLTGSGLGASALDTACRLLEAGQAETMLAGWIEAPPVAPDDWPQSERLVFPTGAIFVVLRPETDSAEPAQQALFRENGTLWKTTGDRRVPIQSLLDLF
ncbi:MAG TPA: beta-ketoacyl synthase N-terminal-like domain-containing protein [Candidatus Sumerlaeota bacterium]|nr:beta-ketoacyl synthase N-terminal-like domain-containing protein [Candidatus Sumerlaeota bacterium]HPS03615.1 beta-ketoacyl synthase N-terminal-like domain-containing protein [Candidatus Sumerlaeota bacterium]